MSTTLVRAVDLEGGRQIAEHQITCALVAFVQGWGVGKVTVGARDGELVGSCEMTQRRGVSSLQSAIEEVTIRLAGHVRSPVRDEVANLERVADLVRDVAPTSESEGQALVDFCWARACSFLERLSDKGIVDDFVEKLIECDGQLDFRHAPQDITSPLIDLHAAPITVNVPPPIINITMPEQQPPTVNVEVPPQPDKVISFVRDSENLIVEAETTTVPAAA